MKSQKIKSQKLHVPILETNRKNLHPQKKTVIRYDLLFTTLHIPPSKNNLKKEKKCTRTSIKFMIRFIIMHIELHLYSTITSTVLHVHMHCIEYFSKNDMSFNFNFYVLMPTF